MRYTSEWAGRTGPDPETAPVPNGLIRNVGVLLVVGSSLLLWAILILMAVTLL